MRNPLSKLAIAAAIVAACIAAVSMWSGTQSGVALANVLTKIEQIRGYAYEISMTAVTPMTTEKDMTEEIEITILIWRGVGQRITTQETTRITTQETTLEAFPVRLKETYILPQQQTVLEIMPTDKTFRRADLNGAQLEELQRQVSRDPGVQVREVLACNYTPLGRSTLDGIAVEVFHSTDPNLLSGTPGDIELRIWVDVQTQLPIRIEREIDFDLPDGRQASVCSVTHDFQWDVVIDANEFDPAIPDDYRDLTGNTEVSPQADEENAVEN